VIYRPLWLTGSAVMGLGSAWAFANANSLGGISMGLISATWLALWFLGGPDEG
jgi:hypothetical protein